MAEESPAPDRHPPTSDAQLTGEQLARVTRELVRLKAQFYGRGPTAAKSYSCDDFLFTVQEGGMTPVEQTLLDHGDREMVTAVRLRYQACMADEYKAAVERATGRRPLTYHSQIVFDPTYTVEIFVLEPRPQDGEGARA